MILRHDSVPVGPTGEGAPVRRALADAAGIAQFGAHVETLQPGERASEPHWHATSEELVLVLEGVLTVVEDGVSYTLSPGDAAAWRAGDPVAHCILNTSEAPCSYFVIGTRLHWDRVHYPESGRILHDDAPAWRLVDASGELLREGEISDPRPLSDRRHPRPSR